MKNQSEGSFTFTAALENEVTKLYTLVFLGIPTDNIRIVFHICVQTIHPVPAKSEPGILVWGEGLPHKKYFFGGECFKF